MTHIQGQSIKYAAVLQLFLTASPPACRAVLIVPGITVHGALIAELQPWGLGDAMSSCFVLCFCRKRGNISGETSCEALSTLTAILWASEIAW